MNEEPALPVVPCEPSSLLEVAPRHVRSTPPELELAQHGLTYEALAATVEETLTSLGVSIIAIPGILEASCLNSARSSMRRR